MQGKKTRHTVTFSTPSGDEGYSAFISEIKRKGGLSKLIGDLLHFYYKDVTVQQGLQNFKLQEDEYYANITQSFTDLISEHQKNGNQVGVGDLSQAQMLQMIMDMSNQMQTLRASTPVYIQQVNPTAYPQNLGAPVQPLQQVPQQIPQQMQVSLTEQQLIGQQTGVQQPVQQPMQQPVQQPIQEQVQQPMQQPVQPQMPPQTAIQQEPVKEDTPQVTQVVVPTPPVQQVNGGAMAGLFDGDDEEVNSDKPKAPASLAKLMKSIKKGNN